MTPDVWLAEFSHALNEYPERASVLAEIREILASGVSPTDFGDPKELASALKDATPASPAPNLPHAAAVFLGKQASFRGLSESPSGRSSWFDPQNPRVFVPRAIGLGWDVNFGAIAVKLGLLREDDCDADVVSAVPDSYLAFVRALPWVGTGLLGWEAVRAGKIAASGRRADLVKQTALAVLASGFATSRRDCFDQLLTSSIASAISGAAAIQSRHHQGLAALPMALPLVLIPLGIRLGLNRLPADSPVTDSARSTNGAF